MNANTELLLENSDIPLRSQILNFEYGQFESGYFLDRDLNGIQAVFETLSYHLLTDLNSSNTFSFRSSRIRIRTSGS